MTDLEGDCLKVGSGSGIRGGALTVIAVVESEFSGRFGIPRQPGLTPSVRARLRLLPPWDRVEAWAGLTGFSHLWLLSWLHAGHDVGAALTVRPPRLGGNRRQGVFASRSPVRPTPIGLSLVRLLGESTAGTTRFLDIEAPDLLDGTPVLDVKPYLPWADAHPEARTPAAFALPPDPCRLAVRYSEEAAVALGELADGARLRAVLSEVIGLDPRPAWQADHEGRRYGMRIAGLEVSWEVRGGCASVLTVAPAAP
jgi:tRNA (adenine37-N6)-methyltransferase